MEWLKRYYEKQLRPQIEAETWAKAEIEVRAKTITEVRDKIRMEVTRKILVDSSALIDGRVLQLYKDNFLDGEIMVPSFILREIQQLADSTDHTTSKKGKRALEAVAALSTSMAANGKSLQFPIHEDAAYPLVDDKLIYYAKTLPNSVVLTEDGNLGKVAELVGVKVINIHALASSLRSMVLPGDRFSIKLVEPGRKADDWGQCIGYLPDGTLVCVDKCREFLGKTVSIEITKVLHNLPTGRIAFARLNWGEK
jgi:uncharacterized protein YacL